MGPCVRRDDMDGNALQVRHSPVRKCALEDTHLCVGYDVQLHVGESITPVTVFSAEQYHRGYGFRVRASHAPE